MRSEYLPYGFHQTLMGPFAYGSTAGFHPPGSLEAAHICLISQSLVYNYEFIPFPHIVNKLSEKILSNIFYLHENIFKDNAHTWLRP